MGTATGATASSFHRDTLLTVSFPSFVFCHFLRCHYFLEGAPAGAGLSRPVADDGAVLTRGPAASNHSNKGGGEFFLINLISRLFHSHSLHHWVFKSDFCTKRRQNINCTQKHSKGRNGATVGEHDFSITLGSIGILVASNATASHAQPPQWQAALQRTKNPVINSASVIQLK